MVLTRQQQRDAMNHILQNVFDRDLDSALYHMFDQNNIRSPLDLLALRPTDYELLTYINDNGEVITMIRGDAGLVKAFISFVLSRFEVNDIMTDDFWSKITREQFDAYRISRDYISIGNPDLAPNPTPVTQTRAPPDPVREFKRGIKRDINNFITLRDDGAWDNWNRATIAQARAQDVDDVLDPNYSPTTSQAQDLFTEKLKYMYAVFEKTLLTDKGKSLVRKYQATFDAQLVYKELKDYALKSTKATMDASKLLSYITSTTLGSGTWKGTTHAFILNWQDQVRKYNTLTPSGKLDDMLVRTMLENAVHPIQELRTVKVQAAQYKTTTGSDLTYAQYCDLLASAAQQYDKQMALTNPCNAQRKVYQHDMLDRALKWGAHV